MNNQLQKLQSLRDSKMFLFNGKNYLYTRDSKFEIQTWNKNCYRTAALIVGDLPRVMLTLQSLKGKKRLLLDGERLTIE